MTGRRSSFVAVLLALTMFIWHAVPAEAAWTRNSYAESVFTTKTIPVPTILSCNLAPGIAGLTPVVTMTWQFPAGSGYVNPTNVNYYAADAGLVPVLVNSLLGTSLTTTGPVGGVYTTQFKSALLSGLLGATFRLALRATENGWYSPMNSYLASMTLAGLNPTCVSEGILP
ncbi:hypothetical protein D1871_19955 [Nakamurella silvestris]|nr:hypothetical protein D1871_19955 [Nakamurella silvestris]